MPAGEPTFRTPILIVGGGPIGLSLAADLGWRGISCMVVDQGKGPSDFPRANAENARTMEFFRRWGIADKVRQSGTPEDYPHTVLYITSLTGHEIARFDRPGHGGKGPTVVSPERPQRCNQLWLDPILRDLATGFETVTLRPDCRFDSYLETADGIRAEVVDLPTGERKVIAADYLIACCGGRSSIAKSLGIEMSGNPALEFNVNIFFKTPELWRQHDKGKAALHFLLGETGVWGVLVEINGQDFWRLGLRGKQAYDNMENLDPHALIRRAVGKDIDYEVVSVNRWLSRDLVSDSYGRGRVFLAGDAAHQNTPQGGFGLNTGMGDAVDLGWKLAAVVQGWGGPGLLDSYEAERRPVAVRNVRQATENITIQKKLSIDPRIAEDGAEADAARAKLGADIRSSSGRTYMTDGTALGYRYENSPICWDDDGGEWLDTITEYKPTSRPGSRAPHAWLADGRSMLDLFGRGFTLLRFGDNAPDATTLERAFSDRRVPLSVHSISEAPIAALYERALVLVRPDGHVAWRGDAPPRDALAVVDRARGAAKRAEAVVGESSGRRMSRMTG